MRIFQAALTLALLWGLAEVHALPAAETTPAPAAFVASVATSAQARAKLSARHLYQVWILRNNRHTGASWWEVYTSTYNHEEALRIVNTLEQIGYQAYSE